MLLDEDFFSFKECKGNASFFSTNFKRNRVSADRSSKSFTKKVAETRVNVIKNFDFEEVMSDTTHI